MSYPYQKGNKVFEPPLTIYWALAIATFGKEAIELREILSALPQTEYARVAPPLSTSPHYLP